MLYNDKAQDPRREAGMTSLIQSKIFKLPNHTNKIKITTKTELSQINTKNSKNSYINQLIKLCKIYFYLYILPEKSGFSLQKPAIMLIIFVF